MSKDRPPKVVIVGAGFGGLFAAKALSRVSADVVLIDRHNYHLFQPLLYQVATAGLAPSDIAWPIRSILTRQRNVSVLLGDVQSVDMDKRLVNFKDEALTVAELTEAFEPHRSRIDPKTKEDKPYARRTVQEEVRMLFAVGLVQASTKKASG